MLESNFLNTLLHIIQLPTLQKLYLSNKQKEPGHLSMTVKGDTDKFKINSFCLRPSSHYAGGM